jgi:serine phosphatase RsbU (regulator of sigma subunit)/tetratricopeptide (TPR) repeat protein
LRLRNYHIDRTSIFQIAVCLFLFLQSTNLRSQAKIPGNKKRIIDSLELVLKTAKEDTNKVITFNHLCIQYTGFDPDKALRINSDALDLTEKIKDKKGMSTAYFVRGNIYNVLGVPDSVIYFHLKALELRKDIKWKKGIAASNGNIGQGYIIRGDFQTAMKYCLESAKISEEIRDTLMLASAYNNLGLVYKGIQDYNRALIYFNKALELKKKKADMNNPLDVKSVANTILNIGIIYDFDKKDLIAKRYYEDALRKFTEIDNLQGQGLCYNNLGGVYYDLGDYAAAIQVNQKSLAIKESLGDELGIASSYINLGADYFALNNIKLAKENHFRALDLILKNGLREERVTLYDAISKDFEGEGDLKNALLYRKKYEAIKDSVLNVQRSEQMTEMQTKYDTELKDKKILEQNSVIKEEALRTKQKETQRNAFIGGFILLVGMTFFIFRGYKQKKQSLAELSQKNKIIEEKNKDITDSINYAKRIQEVILPEKEIAAGFLPESFVIYKPKDVISGDFYWYNKKNNRKIITAADCTGHGVPGALMSMIGIAFLNEVVNEKGIVQPSEILGELRNKVKISLKQTGEVGESKDGMDMALLAFHDDYSKVEFAGANNPLWLLTKRSGSWEMIQYTADKRPIGYFMGKSLPFTNHSIDLQKGDLLYIFSDGFADQFGGPKGKKLKYSKMKEIITAMAELPLKEQKERLESYFMEWKGSLEQVDDVCVIGIRV